ncbi:hypothetical protein SAMN06297387_10171 [Streptomyces zhaozhouensis]|uniref:DUF6745 domain-containing protein n=1 Tax=Streptomyces zhaozhouensis TaxID=1300267 RepID=A0A286DI14_9ACTN|nr:hypothetical protein [Streptomyces zhaozhouensis]SOD58281.1 hypothetical protein SAMN06297387_10171 [Streptomyces zhaozhouensis]
MSERMDWRTAALATGPSEREAAEEGVRLAYRRAGLPEPESVEWVASPLAAARLLSGAGRTERGASVRQAVRDRPVAEERAAVHAELGPLGWGERWRATGAEVWALTAPLVERVRTAVVAELAPGRQDEPALRVLMLEAVLGPQEAPWIAALRPDGEPNGLDGLAAVAGAAGWWWPYERRVVLSERPTEIHRDELGRLHRMDGPALVFPDGFALHAFRGMPVPPDFLEELESLTPQRITDEGNAELRRVMFEHYGYERYLRETGAKPVDRDETGVLWRIAQFDDEDIVMVEVVNSTPEPDGTRRTYWLRVPPRTRTAREAVAWTFGLDAESYAPSRQT